MADERMPTHHLSVPISSLSISRLNPRRTRPLERVAELRDHIKATRYDLTRAVKCHRGEDGKLLVFAGGTRLQAAIAAGCLTLPVYEYVGYSDAELWRMAYEDNANDGKHADLPITDVWADYAAHRAAGESLQQIADQLGVSVPVVSKRVKWNGLAKPLKKAVFDGLIDEGHLEAVDGVTFDVESLAPWLTTAQAQAELLDEVLGKHRGSSAGIKPTVRVVREAANRWKEMIGAAEDCAAELGKKDHDGRWVEMFVAILVQRKARTQAAVLASKTDVIVAQKQAAKAEADAKRKQADAAEKEAAEKEAEEERQTKVQAFVAKAVIGDARKELAGAPYGAKLMLTDPPYGKAYESQRRKATPRKGEIAGDDGVAQAAELLGKVLEQAWNRLATDAHVLVFCDWRAEPEFRRELELAGFALKSSVIWVKANHGTGDVKGSFAPRHERILHAVKGKPTLTKRLDDVLMGYEDMQSAEHPNAKPPGLLRDLIDATTVEGDLVLDPFAGSGSTLVKAHELGRDFWGCEVDESWHRKITDALFAIATGKTVR